jgi:hypothetical protein
MSSACAFNQAPPLRLLLLLAVTWCVRNPDTAQQTSQQLHMTTIPQGGASKASNYIHPNTHIPTEMFAAAALPQTPTALHHMW